MHRLRSSRSLCRTTSSRHRRDRTPLTAVRHEARPVRDPQHGPLLPALHACGRTASTASIRTSPIARPSSSPAPIHPTCSRASPQAAAGGSPWSVIREPASPPIWAIGPRRRLAAGRLGVPTRGEPALCASPTPDSARRRFLHTSGTCSTCCRKARPAGSRSSPIADYATPVRPWAIPDARSACA